MVVSTRHTLMPTHPFYGSIEWKAARLAALKRAGYRCENCGVSVARKHASRVDHKRPRDQYPELALDPSNLRVLCVDCDARRHAHKGNGKPAGEWIDVKGTNSRGYPTSPAHPWNARK